jgi:hypothetical protein
MRRIILLLTVAAMMALMLVVSAAPAFAQPEGRAKCATVIGGGGHLVITPSGVINENSRFHFHTCALEPFPF